MTMTLTLSWWVIPTAITVLALLWALFWPADDSGFMGGIVRLFMLMPALGITAIAWIIAAVLK